MSAISPDDADFVTALARGLDVITCFGEDADRLTLSEVAARTGLTRGTARRFLLTLEALGYVRAAGRTFELTPRTLRLGYAYLSSMPIWKAALPIMKQLVDRLDESCSLGAIDGHDVVYVARTLPKHLFYAPIQLGTRMPAHINAMGQVLLAERAPAELDRYFRTATFEKFTKYTLTDEKEIRRILVRVSRNGYAISDRQLQIGIRSIAVPVRQSSGASEFAINVTVNEGRASKQDLVERFLPALRDAAEQLSQLLSRRA